MVSEKSVRTKPFYKTILFRWLIGGLGVLLVLVYVSVSVYGAITLTTSTTHNAQDLEPNTPTMPYENVTFKTSDKAQLTMRGWWIPRENSRRVLIMVHAKDGTRTFLLPVSQRLWQEGFNILLYDTRGQGQSEGDHYSFGWYEKYDVVGAVNFVKSKGFQPSSIGAVGWSMGAATTLLAMAETPDIKAGLAESSFGNLDRVFQGQFSSNTGLPDFFYPGIRAAAGLLFGFEVLQTNPEKVFPKLGDRKVFLIHGEKDQVVPVSEFYRLIEAGGANVAENWLVPSTEHVRSFQNYPDEYIKRAVAFFNRELS